MPRLICDIRPKLVKAIVSIEPTGPPFVDRNFSSRATRPYGLTDVPLTFSPAPANPTAPLQTKIIPSSVTGLTSCIIQASQLGNW